MMVINFERKQRFVERCNTFCLWSICLFMFGCSVSGGGHYLSIGPLTPRILLGALIILLSIPELILNFRTYIRNPLNLLTLLFLVVIAVDAARGYNAGNNLTVLATDIKGFLWLTLVPVFIAQIRNYKQLNRVLNFVLAGALLQALMVFIINAYCSAAKDNITLIYQPIQNSMLGSVSIISGHIYRIFMKSSPYFVVACVTILFRQVHAKKLIWRYVFAFSFLTEALLLSYTRSLYGCFCISIVLAIVAALWIWRKNWRKICLFLLASVACFFVLNTALEITYESSYLNFALARTLHLEISDSIPSQIRGIVRQQLHMGTDNSEDDGSDSRQDYLVRTEQSDNLRAQTKSELMDLIGQSPVIGNGLGASTQCRQDNDEYFYLDMLARVGIVGLVLYLLPYAFVVLSLLRHRQNLAALPMVVSIVISTLAFWIVTWFNPWMNAVLGIAWYAITNVAPTVQVTAVQRVMND